MNKSSQIISKVKALDDLRFHDMPSRPVKVVQVCHRRGVTVAIGAKGKIYTSQKRNGALYRSARRMVESLECLIAMGLLTASAIEEHAAQQVEDRRKETLAEAATNMLMDAQTLEFPMSEEQGDMLRRLAKL